MASLKSTVLKDSGKVEMVLQAELHQFCVNP